MYTNYLISDDYLMHYGVKGMKWGVRHDPERSAQRARNKAAKGQLKAARKQFNKDYNRAYYYSERHPVSQFIKKSPTYAESNRRWDQANSSAKKLNAAKKNYRNVAGKGRDRLDTAAQIVKGVGVVAAAAAVGYGSVYLATNPAVASSVSKAMKTGLGNIAKNAKRGASYMKNARYNKAVQLASPGAASKAEFKRSTYKAMKNNAGKIRSNYDRAVPKFGSSKTTAKDILNSAKGSKAGKAAKGAAESATRKVDDVGTKVDIGVSRARATAKNAPGNIKNAAGRAKDSTRNAADSAYISGYNKYADARTAASRTARRASTDAKIIREGVKDSARSASSYVRTDARMAGQQARNTVDSAREGVSNATSKIRTRVSNRTTQYKNRNNPRLRSNNSARSRRYTNNR